jgi:hypothetical protein
MTPKEMHIRVLNDLSGLAAQRTRKFHPEQIELALNAEVEQYVADATKENPRGYYTVDADYLDGVQSLIETSSLAVHNVGVKKSAYVPLNSLKLLDAYAFGGYKGVLLPTTLPVTLHIYTLVVTQAVTTPAYKNVEFKVGTESVYKRTSTTGYPLVDLHQLIDELLGAVPNLAWEIAYGQKYDGRLVYASEISLPVSLTIDGKIIFSVEQKAITGTTVTIPKNIGMSTRRIKNQLRSEVLSTPYYKASVVDLPVLFQQSTLDVHTPDNYIVNSLLVTYIRRPRKISLSLNIGCDLDPGCHPIICDNTVQRIRERIGDPKLQTGTAI